MSNARIVNALSNPINPKTDASVVTYNGTTVQQQLDVVDRVIERDEQKITQLENNLNSTAQQVESLNEKQSIAEQQILLNTSNIDKLQNSIEIDEGKINNLTQQSVTFNSHISNTNNPHQVTAEQVGLGNVDNTSDLNKPVSTAMQEALAQKAGLSEVQEINTTISSLQQKVSELGTKVQYLQNEVNNNVPIINMEKLFTYKNVANNFTLDLLDNVQIHTAIITGDCNLTLNITGEYRTPVYTTQIRIVFAGNYNLNITTTKGNPTWINGIVPDFSDYKPHWLVVRAYESWSEETQVILMSDAGTEG